MEPFVPEELPILSLDWKRLIPILGEANREIAHYGGVLHSVLNPALLLSPMTTQEAVLSAAIEGTQATLGEVLRFEAGEVTLEEGRKDDFQEIVNYRRALSQAQRELESRPFNLNLLLELHATLLDSVRGRFKGPGRFRTTQNWIGPENRPIEEAYFVPPAPSTLSLYLDRWEKYYHATELDALVQLAIVHAQFEIIHPFSDGNGRLGRLLIPIFLYEKKLLQSPMFFLSESLEVHRNSYERGLRDLGKREGAWDDWVEFFLRIVARQALKNTLKALSIKKLYEELKIKVIALTRSQFAIPLLDQIFFRPVFSSADLAVAQPCPSRPALNNLVRALSRGGVIKQLREASGQRGALYVQAELLNVCEGREIF
jgi:Fic family protein